jgi:glycolate oxidase iron-sulfur subunit
VAEVRLPDSSGRKTHCCGGPDELLYPDIAGGVTRARMKQLREAGGKLTVTACPVCLLNLRREGEVMDISNLLVRRMKPGS